MSKIDYYEGVAAMSSVFDTNRGWPRYATALSAVSGGLLGLGIAQLVMAFLAVDASSWQLGTAAVVLGMAGIAWYRYASTWQQCWKRDRKRRGLDWRS